jgi:hypothetical protein
VIHKGAPWGALHEKITGRRLSRALVFELPEEGDASYPEARPWLELLENGKFSPETLRTTPLSYQTRPEWIALLQESAEAHGATWLHDLHLGIYLAEIGGVAQPTQLFQDSLRKRPSPIAERNLAVLSQNASQATQHFLNAWKLAVDLPHDDPARPRLLRNLAVEVCNFFLSIKALDDLEHFLGMIEKADPDVKGLDTVVLAHAQVPLSAA